MGWIVVLLVAGLPFVWVGLPHLQRRREERRLAELCAARRAIVLSYDDGPGRALTPELADLLQRHGVKATFFLIGQRAAQHPDLVARLRQDGHEIGNHTENHANAWKVAPWTAPGDIRKGQATLVGLGLRPRLFRPPYGKATLATRLACAMAKQRFAFWTVDSRDSWEEPSSVEAVLARIRRKGGGVVLMHDSDAPPRTRQPQAHPDHVLALTGAIINLAANEGFSMLTVGDLLGLAAEGAAHG